MPGILKNKDDKGLAEAVQPSPDAAIPNGDSNSEIRPQPRQPTSLHGLLRFAMEATKSEDAPSTSNLAPMDPEVSVLVKKKKTRFLLCFVFEIETTIS